MKLNELYDAPLAYSWGQRSDKKWAGTFVVDGLPYKITFDWESADQSHVPLNIINNNNLSQQFEQYGVWVVEFSIASDQLTKKARRELKGKLGPSYNVVAAGTGNEFAVFSTVVAMIKEFIQQVRPMFLNFDSEEPSRTKLYTRMAKRLGSNTFTFYKGSGITSFLVII